MSAIAAMARVIAARKTLFEVLIVYLCKAILSQLASGYPAGLWQGMQSFEPGTLPLRAGRAAMALS